MAVLVTGVASERDLQAGNADADRVLARRAAEGDTDAFRALVDRYQRPMAALVSRMVGRPDDVDDILQEVFLRAWKGLPRFRHDAQFSTWLYRIAVNTALKARKRGMGAPSTISTDDLLGGEDQLAADADGPAAAGGDPFGELARRERESRVRDAIETLPEKQRAVVVLHYFEGHTCEEIGKLVGCSVGTVWSRLHYACKRLKDTLGEL